MNNDVLDFWGNKIQKGNVILLTRGGKHSRYLEMGFVIDVKAEGSAQYSHVVKFYELPYYGIIKNQVANTYQPSLNCKFYVSKGFNRAITVVSSFDEYSPITKALIKTANILVSQGIYPEGYDLGQSINEDAEKLAEEVKVLNKEAEFNENVLLDLDLPKSLRK